MAEWFIHTSVVEVRRNRRWVIGAVRALQIFMGLHLILCNGCAICNEVTVFVVLEALHVQVALHNALTVCLVFTFTFTIERDDYIALIPLFAAENTSPVSRTASRKAEKNENARRVLKNVIKKGGKIRKVWKIGTDMRFKWRFEMSNRNVGQRKNVKTYVHLEVLVGQTFYVWKPWDGILGGQYQSIKGPWFVVFKP